MTKKILPSGGSKPVTKYIKNVGNKAGLVGDLAADIVTLPLRLTATGIRGIANEVDVAKTAVSSSVNVFGKTLSNGARNVANTLSYRNYNSVPRKYIKKGGNINASPINNNDLLQDGGRKKRNNSRNKPVTRYIKNVGRSVGFVGNLTADLVTLPVKITATGIRGVAKEIDIAKNALSRSSSVLGDTLSNSARNVANTLAYRPRKFVKGGSNSMDNSELLKNLTEVKQVAGKKKAQNKN